MKFSFRWMPRNLIAAAQSVLAVLSMLFMFLPFVSLSASGTKYGSWSGYEAFFGTGGENVGSPVGVLLFFALLVLALLPWLPCFLQNDRLADVVSGAEGMLSLVCAVGFFFSSTKLVLDTYTATFTHPHVGSILCGLMMLTVGAGSVLPLIFGDDK